VAEPASVEPARLILLRHGRTAWNAADRAQGHVDVDLDEVGQQQAEAVAGVLAKLSPSRLWTSDLIRARRTAGFLEEATGLVAVPDPRLREYALGVRSGLTRSEFAAAHPMEYAAWIAGSPDPLVAGEEPTTAVAVRMATVLAELLAVLEPGQTGIAVSHGACLKVGIPALLGWSSSAARAIAGMDNCGWAVIDQSSVHPGPRLTAYNRTC